MVKSTKSFFIIMEESLYPYSNWSENHPITMLENDILHFDRSKRKTDLSLVENQPIGFNPCFPALVPCDKNV